MDISRITSGRNPPKDIHAVIEIPLGGVPVKYEIDKDVGRAVRRPLPAHGDVLSRQLRLHPAHACRPTATPATCWSSSQVPVVPGAVIRCRPVGALVMEDEAGGDEKILAVPVDALHPFYTGVQSYRDLPRHHVRADRALLPALQGSGKGQVGDDRELARRRGAEQLVMDAIERYKGYPEPKIDSLPKIACVGLLPEDCLFRLGLLLQRIHNDGRERNDQRQRAVERMSQRLSNRRDIRLQKPRIGLQRIHRVLVDFVGEFEFAARLLSIGDQHQDAGNP